MKVVNRIKKTEDFAFTIKKGKCFSNSNYTIHKIKTDKQITRVGLSVSTKLGDAVTRNRVKRQIRAICNQIIDFNKDSMDIVIIAKKAFLLTSFEDNKKLLTDIIFK